MSTLEQMPELLSSGEHLCELLLLLRPWYVFERWGGTVEAGTLEKESGPFTVSGISPGPWIFR